MRTIITALVAALFATGVSAGGLYHGLEEGNPDLSTEWVGTQDFVGVQPSIGDRTEPYQGLARGNPDLCESDRTGGTGTCEGPDVYGGFSGNDLDF